MSRVTQLHVGLIPDGNRRWCHANDVPIFDLLRMLRSMLLVSVADTTQPCHNMNRIGRATLYLLSLDNLEKRKDNTVEMVRRVLEAVLDEVRANTLLGSKWSFEFVGELHRLPTDMRALCMEIEDLTVSNDTPLAVLIAYDPVQDCRRQCVDGAIVRPAIDLVIRTGGERRSSGFPPLQTLYSEWVYLDKMFPALTQADVDEAIAHYLSRQRRFGA